MTLAVARGIVLGAHPTARCRRRVGYAIEVAGPHGTVALYGTGTTEQAAWVDAARRVLGMASRPA